MTKPTKANAKLSGEAKERAYWEAHNENHLSKVAAANARDVRYQSLIKVWLQEKLRA